MNIPDISNKIIEAVNAAEQGNKMNGTGINVTDIDRSKEMYRSITTAQQLDALSQDARNQFMSLFPERYKLITGAGNSNLQEAEGDNLRKDYGTTPAKSDSIFMKI